MADLATAYLRLIPSLKGAQKTIENELGGVSGTKAGAKVGESFGGGITSGIGKLAIGTAIGGMIQQGVQAAAGAAVDTFKNAFDNIGEFEQLKGGVEKIFNEANIEQILADAQGAYEDLNMSANEYLASINQTGAAFAQTMGDQKGYDTARTGMKAIADYASGTGRNLSELNEKYAMITRATSSYQSIADQFSGILPATSADFLAQAQAAGFLSGEYKKLTDVPVAEYQEAVSKMLEKGVDDMGLLGNTAAESTGTLTGSIAMTQAAWQNFLTSLGGGDVQAALTNLMTSASAMMGQIGPVVLQIVQGAAAAIRDFASQASVYFLEHQDEIFAAAGEFIMQILTAIMQALPMIIGGIVMLLGSLITQIITHIPQIAEAAIQLIGEFFNSILTFAPQGESTIGEIIGAMLVAAGNFVNDMVQAGANLVQGLIDGIAQNIAGVASAITGGLQDAVNGALSFLGIASPSKLFKGIGMYTMQGMALGIGDTAGAVQSEMRSAVEGVYAEASRPAMAIAAAVDASEQGAGSEGSALGNIGIYLDGKVLVGYLAPGMDRALVVA